MKRAPSARYNRYGSGMSRSNCQERTNIAQPLYLRGANDLQADGGQIARAGVAIAIELAIVITGVFIGTQVANWNQERLERSATNRMLDQLRPEIKNQFEFFDSARVYYKT